MKEDVKEMFAQITMPEAAEERIRTAMARKGRSTHRPVWKKAAAFAAMLALVLVLSPTARAAANQWIMKYFWPDSGITIYEVHDGETDATVAAVSTEVPPFARMIGGRLYFMGNGEEIDITDQISQDSPFYYSYVDAYGMTHDMAVGYSGSIENYGIYEFIWQEIDEKKIWTTGTGRNFLDPETETRYPWVDIVWEHLDIPWPMPQ